MLVRLESLPRPAAHVPSAADHDKSNRRAGSASFAHAAPIGVAIPLRPNIWHACNQVEHEPSVRRVCIAHVRAGFLTIHSRGTRLCPILNQSFRAARPLNSGVRPMDSDGGTISKLGLVAMFIAAVLFFLFLSDSGDKVQAVTATVVANIAQVGDIRSPENQVQVRLPSGVVVNATVPANSGFPFAKGTSVQVTPYRSRASGKSTYRVEAPRARP